MIKQYKKELIVSTLLALLPIAAGLLLWNRLPGQLATHWGMHGADRWSGKAAAVFLQPLLLLAAHYLVLFFVFRDAKNRNQSKKVVGLLFWMIPPSPSSSAVSPTRWRWAGNSGSPAFFMWGWD